MSYRLERKEMSSDGWVKWKPDSMTFDTFEEARARGRSLHDGVCGWRVVPSSDPIPTPVQNLLRQATQTPVIVKARQIEPDSAADVAADRNYRIQQGHESHRRSMEFWEVIFIAVWVLAMLFGLGHHGGGGGCNGRDPSCEEAWSRASE
jgi:hypothetical protein